MPRGKRIDAPGAVHHVIGRGIERSGIFISTADYEHFVIRLGEVLTQAGSQCLAWTLMPNHYHLVLRTATYPLNQLMARLLTSYALGFNRRHHRSGYVFQDRYKSILCEEEAYLLELVRYVHLNPVRAGLVEGGGELAAYPWCGHGVILGLRHIHWQDTETVLDRFGHNAEQAVAAYRKFIDEALVDPAQSNPSSRGAMFRQAGQIDYLGSRDKRHVGLFEHIAGTVPFIQEALEQSGDVEVRRSRLQRLGWTPVRVVARAAEVCGLAEDQVYGAGKRERQVRARALSCKWLIDDLGVSGAEVAKVLRISQPTVSQSLERGRMVAGELGFRLEEDENARRIQ